MNLIVFIAIFLFFLFKYDHFIKKLIYSIAISLFYSVFNWNLIVYDVDVYAYPQRCTTGTGWSAPRSFFVLHSFLFFSFFVPQDLFWSFFDGNVYCSPRCTTVTAWRWWSAPRETCTCRTWPAPRGISRRSTRAAGTSKTRTSFWLVLMMVRKIIRTNF